MFTFSYNLVYIRTNFEDSNLFPISFDFYFIGTMTTSFTPKNRFYLPGPLYKPLLANKATIIKSRHHLVIELCQKTGNSIEWAVSLAYRREHMQNLAFVYNRDIKTEQSKFGVPLRIGFTGEEFMIFMNRIREQGDTLKNKFALNTETLRIQTPSYNNIFTIKMDGEYYEILKSFHDVKYESQKLLISRDAMDSLSSGTLSDKVVQYLEDQCVGQLNEQSLCDIVEGRTNSNDELEEEIVKPKLKHRRTK